MKARLAVVLAVAASMALLGCGKDNPTKVIIDPPLIYPDRSTPKNTVLRMALAVANRDTVVTASVYADDYEGTSMDLVDPNPVTFTFFKSDEIRAIAAMALSSSILRVDMDLGSPAGWFQIHYASDPPDWIAIEIPHGRIYVNDVALGEYDVQWPSVGDTRIFEFKLKPTTPDPSSPTDTTWQIVRWVESRSQT